jgi:integrase
MAYAWQMKKDGRSPETIETAIQRLTRLTQQCNIEDPEDVKAQLANSNQAISTKKNIASIYNQYLTYNGKTWNRPHWKQQAPPPFIPTEEELDTLINAGRPKTACLLQSLKETGARIGEMLLVKWTDIDTQRRTISITPEKGSNPRILPISPKLIDMLNQIPHNNEHVFPTIQHSKRVTFTNLRKRTAKKLGNPRLLKIHFHTFRHWKGTMEYHKTKDIIHVQHVLGQKDIENTMIYINLDQALFNTQSDEWTCKATNDLNEAKQLIETGFEYVCDMNGYSLYRKRK